MHALVPTTLELRCVVCRSAFDFAARVLTESPALVDDAVIDALFKAGWSERRDAGAESR